eukprot:TRINITY_DN4013_c0_g3_i1.p1 TRINITY_DN4013_c0_g3~~TRINITY_DN4013_c0_g3_i1.p1  ORF type:complete len:367 (-),score=105.13 TRINITY_DN4013_c0_g3_i1:53-1153(-)
MCIRDRVSTQSTGLRSNEMVDIDSLSVKELKAFIAERGLSSADCVEKSDLRTRAREAHARAPLSEEVASAAPSIMRMAAPSVTKRAVHDACREGDAHMVAKLLTDPSNLNIADHEGHTPLMLAAWEGHQEVVKMLIERSAELDLRNKMGNSALHLASWWGRCETMQMLLEAGANLGAIDGDGDFALHHAARNNKIDAVRLLVQWGSPAGVLNKVGKTPIQLAIECGHLEAALELEKVTKTKRPAEGEGDDKKKKKKKKFEKPEEGQNTCVYVTGLPTQELTDTWVKNVFQKAGKVFKVKLYHHANLTLKGDALVTYLTAEAAIQAVNQFNGHEIRTGCIVSVTVADFGHKTMTFTPGVGLAEAPAW